MKFSEAEKALKAGKKIKLPKWEKAYWYMNQDDELINHFEEGKELPTIALFPRDMIWVTRDDWEIVHEDEPKNVNEPAGEMKKLRNFGWAIAALKKGKKVARKNGNGKGTLSDERYIRNKRISRVLVFTEMIVILAIYTIIRNIYFLSIASTSMFAVSFMMLIPKICQARRVRYE